MKNKLPYILLSLSLLLFSLPAFADTGGCSGTPSNLHTLLGCYIAYKIQNYVPFLIAVALLVFLIGVVRFVGAGDNEESRQAGRNVMIFGIIVLFVMISVWGIVGLLYNTFFTGSINLPTQLPATLPNN